MNDNGHGEWDRLMKEYSAKNTDYLMKTQSQEGNVDFRDSFVGGKQDEKIKKYVTNLRDLYKGCSSLNMHLVYASYELYSNDIENVKNVFNKAYKTYEKLKRYYELAENII